MKQDWSLEEQCDLLARCIPAVERWDPDFREEAEWNINVTGEPTSSMFEIFAVAEEHPEVYEDVPSDFYDFLRWEPMAVMFHALADQFLEHEPKR